MNRADKIIHRKRLRTLRRLRTDYRETRALQKIRARRRRQRIRDARNPTVKVRRAGHLKGQRLIVLRSRAVRRIEALRSAARGEVHRRQKRLRRQARSINRAVAGLVGWVG